MEKKNLIVYMSNTGNTEMIAKEIAKNFGKYGWHNDLKKINKDYDVKNPGFSFQAYDFVCVGSPVHNGAAIQEIRNLVYGEPEKRRLFPGPKCGLVFCTYAGPHLGPLEAEPCLKMLEVALSHREFEVIGTISTPGHGKNDPPNIYYEDLKERPNEKDFKRVELFVEDIMLKLKGKQYYREII